MSPPLFDYRFGNVHTPIVTMQIKNKSIRRVEICELELVTVKQWDIPDPWRDATTKRFDDFGVNLPSPIKIDATVGSSARMYTRKTIRPFSSESITFTILTDHEANGFVLGFFCFCYNQSSFMGSREICYYPNGY